MSITRPIGEQLTFKSAKTGDHILDTYLEAVERGTRTLSEIIDEIIDSSGNLRTDIFEFREAPLAADGTRSGILQARVGTFIDDSEGWTNVSSANFATFVTDCQAAQAAAETAETNVTEDLALTNADVVLTHADVELTRANAEIATADKVQTGLDRVATGSDKTATNADVALTNQDAVLAQAAKVQTGIDRSNTAADVVSTNANVVITNANVVTTTADAASTASDVVSTNADVELTHADVALAEADKVQTGLDRAAVADDLTLTNTKASEANTSALAASASAAQAAAIYDNFDNRYLGAKTVVPTLNNDGDALITGNLYFLTGTGMQVWDGATWIAASASSNVSMFEYEYIATAGQTTFSGVDANGVRLSYTANNIHVTYGGLDIPQADYTATSGTSIVLADGALAGKIVRIVAFQSFVVADTYTQAQADARYKAIGASEGGPSLGTNSIIRTNANTISENITIPANTNGMSAGPITIADGFTITVNGVWSIV